MNTTRHRTVRSFGVFAAGCLSCSLAFGGEIEGFTEPFRDIDVAASESGIIDSIAVKEGDRVTKGQVLGHLDQDILKATLEIADKTRTSTGRIKSAQADVRLKTERLAKLKILLERKHATQEEVDRTSVEHEVSQAQLLAVQEELTIRDLEYKRIQVQIEQRTLRSPIDGVVTRVVKDQGEFVVPNDPVVVAVVQLDPLLAVIPVPSLTARELVVGKEVQMKLGEDHALATGTVEFIAPVTDAQSGTILVKVRIPNPANKFRSGEKCLLIVAGETPTGRSPEQASVTPASAPTPPQSAPASKQDKASAPKGKRTAAADSIKVIPLEVGRAVTR